MILRRFLLVWCILALAAAQFITPNRAAAATCYGASCNGIYPQTAGCYSDAVLVSRLYYLARYYSPSCNAYFGIAWAVVGDTTFVWMSPNENASSGFGLNMAVSRMWNSGLACTSYGSVSVYCT